MLIVVMTNVVFSVAEAAAMDLPLLLLTMTFDVFCC
jgi:hypothetical protein